MLDKLRVKVLYDDFISKTNLTDEQIEILNKLLKKDKIIKIALDMGMSERTIKYQKKKIEEIFKDYYNLELMKILVLINWCIKFARLKDVFFLYLKWKEISDIILKQ